MKSSEILKEAARICENSHYCGCYAIARALGDGRARMYEEYEIPASIFGFFKRIGPARANPDKPWWKQFDQEGQNARIIGLCLAAAIAESEGQ